MEQAKIEISVKGQIRAVPSIRVEGSNVTVTGKWIKVAAILDEAFSPKDEAVTDPELFISRLKQGRLKPDIFTFAQEITNPNPRFKYQIEWDNAAAACTESFTNWWKKLPQETRKNVRRAAKREVSVRVVPFDDELVKGIKTIYDESPVRQGMRFWHFGKDIETVKIENGTYLERSEFIGAYHKDELIGFMKFVRVDRVAKIMQILSKHAHYDKRPMNALIAKAVEVCQDRGISHLVYSQFIFGNKKDSHLTEFKRRNGFEQLLFPRYYIPLTLKGKLALKMNLHRGLLGVLPSKFINLLLRLRSTSIRIRCRLFSRSTVEQDNFRRDTYSPV